MDDPRCTFAAQMIEKIIRNVSGEVAGNIGFYRCRVVGQFIRCGYRTRGMSVEFDKWSRPTKFEVEDESSSFSPSITTTFEYGC